LFPIYAYGMEMPGRKWIGTADKFRYSHNDQEREDDLFAGANSAEYWMYDSRIGRRWEIDPLAYEDQSPYVAFNNNPVYYCDPLGLIGGPGPAGQKLDEWGCPIATGEPPGSPTANLMNQVLDYMSTTGITGATDRSVWPLANAFGAGALNAIAHDNSLGGVALKSPTSYGDPEQRRAFLMGQILGHLMTLLSGAVEAHGGAQAAGQALYGGPITAIVIAPEAVAVMTHGVTAISYATDGLIKAAQELSALNNNNGNGNFEPKGGEGPGNSSTASDDYEQARNKALDWLKDNEFKAEEVVLGKFGKSKGKPIGYKTKDGKTGFRVEYDGKNGAHINVWSGKTKGPHFQFKGNEKTVLQIIKRFKK
jgi:RHS repeat-associated protein